MISSSVENKFSSYWLAKINEFKRRECDNLNHNKLRTYSVFKGSFTVEPYLALVRNRNQRSYLTRLRVGSHNLAIEIGRMTRPPTPLTQRVCTYCTPPPAAGTTLPPQTSCVDTEFHFLIECPRFDRNRKCFYDAISSINPNFISLSDENKFSCLMCPTSAPAIKLTNRFIKNMFDARKNIDSGT